MAQGEKLRCLPLVSEAPVVGLNIEPTPGNRLLSQFQPDPAGNQSAGILTIPFSQYDSYSVFDP